MKENSMISKIIKRILSFFNKNLCLQASGENINTETTNVKEFNFPKNDFIENTYEINCWQTKIENGAVRVEDLPLELKLKIIADYDKKIEQLEFEKVLKFKKLESMGIKIGE